MRFVCIQARYAWTNTPPTAEEMAAMGQLIGDMAKAGVLLGAKAACRARSGRASLGGRQISA